MKYNPDIHHRRSIRLKGYDYSQAGLYFVTICVQNRECLFGEIVGADLRVCPDEMGAHAGAPQRAPLQPPAMILNDAGRMVEKWVVETQNKFPDIKINDYVIMPNHFHAIIENTGTGNPVGADLRVCPNEKGRHAGLPVQCPDEMDENDNILDERDNILGEQICSPLHRVLQWFKTMTTNEYIRGVKTLGWQPFDKRLWQRNYWERIIRNEKSHQNIAEYIQNNPINWDKDTLNMNN
jgi:REP element-mobilizing transposase RayT